MPIATVRLASFTGARPRTSLLVLVSVSMSAWRSASAS